MGSGSSNYMLNAALTYAGLQNISQQNTTAGVQYTVANLPNSFGGALAGVGSGLNITTTTTYPIQQNWTLVGGGGGGGGGAALGAYVWPNPTPVPVKVSEHEPDFSLSELEQAEDFIRSCPTQ